MQRNDLDTAQLYEHGDVQVMKFIRKSVVLQQNGYWCSGCYHGFYIQTCDDIASKIVYESV